MIAQDEMISKMTKEKKNQEEVVSFILKPKLSSVFSIINLIIFEKSNI